MAKKARGHRSKKKAMFKSNQHQSKMFRKQAKDAFVKFSKLTKKALARLRNAHA